MLNAELTKADYRAFNLFLYLHYRFHLIIMAIWLGATALYTHDMVKDPDFQHSILAAFIACGIVQAAFLGVVFLLLFVLLKGVVWRCTPQLGRHTWELGEAAFKEQNASTSSESRYENLTVHERRNHAFVLQRNGTGYILPKRAELSSAFIRDLKSRIAAGRGG